MRGEHAQGGEGRLLPRLEVQPARPGGGAERQPGGRHPGQAGQPPAQAAHGAGQGGSHGGRHLLCPLKPLQVSSESLLILKFVPLILSWWLPWSVTQSLSLCDSLPELNDIESVLASSV